MADRAASTGMGGGTDRAGGAGTPAWRRRDVLRSGGVVALGAAALSGCDLLSTDPESAAGRGAAARDGGAARGGGGGSAGRGAGAEKEAPTLARRVKAGELPALADRLPASPLVVDPVEKPGVYGGAWHTALSGPDDGSWLQRTIGYEGLVRWRRKWSGAPGTVDIIPNVAKSFEANDDGTEYTFVLRTGMAWSDGEPFTADDIVFAQNDVFNNTELYPVQENNPTAKKVDDHTVRFTFDRPAGLFLQQQATGTGIGLVSKPAHYLRDFHKSYNTGVTEEAKKAGHANWTEYFGAQADMWNNTELPSICAWHVKVPPGKSTRVIAERNPYYWKTDPRGRQLPYLDQVVYDVISSSETMVLKAGNGEFDMHVRHINILQNKPVLARNRSRGNFGFFDTIPDNMNYAILMLNLTHKDPVLRRVFQAKDFRIGLSHAINRPEIVTSVFQRQGRPWQVAPRPEDELADTAMATQYTEHDVARANAHLDRVVPDRGADGVRLRPDGKPLAFTLAFPSQQNVYFPDLLEAVRTYWGKVGIDLRVRSQSYGLWAEKIDSNDHDALVWIGDTGYSASTMLQPRYYLSAGYNLFCVEWLAWYESRGKEGIRPPAAMRRGLRLYDRLLATTDTDEQGSLLRQIFALAKEELYTIGTVLPAKGYGIVRNDFHNVPTMVDGWQYLTPGPTDPEQYYSTR